MPSDVGSSPPPIFDAISEPPASTAPSSPPPDDAIDHDEEEGNSTSIFGLDDDLEKRYSRLKHVLEKSMAYTNILKEAMEKRRAWRDETFEDSASSPKSKGARSRRTRKRIIVEDSDEEDDGHVSKRLKASHQASGDDATTSHPTDDPTIFTQPDTITGAQLKEYQLEGVQWMVSLHQSGVSGILADEMGLGKTLQTIAFTAYLREVNRHPDPILIVCPLSVLHNWIEEYKKFAPSIPVLMYHGSPEERAEFRKTCMRRLAPKHRPGEGPTPPPAAPSKSKGRGKPRKQGGGRRARGKGTRKGRKFEEELVIDEEDEEEVLKAYRNFPIVVTTYEMIIKDRVHLADHNWGYIVVDEGHRLKNLDCRLMQEIKKYQSTCRMILTGTPLHNNVAELWALMNFVLPDIFDDLNSFQEWFNLPEMRSTLGTQRTEELVHILHAILKPFILRRLKVDVETSLPPKKEYVLYAPLSIAQRDAYDQVLDGTLRSYLIKAAEGKNSVPAKNKTVLDADAPRMLRKRRNNQANGFSVLDGDDDEYFEKLAKGELNPVARSGSDTKSASYRQQVVRKKVNNMKLQNTVMQLRKVCSHPFLFDWPVDPKSNQPILDDELVAASGKMMVLDRLLTALFHRKHKVLLFSQFTTMLDIIEDWAVELKGWRICRIDGSTAPLDRRNQMDEFQSGGDDPDAPQLFLLSTRAGGLGITLTAADTVIFYDQDWNPQMDAQAQDRAHRIGQTKPVLIFRLVSAHTIETKIMQRATEKRQIEALVIAKGKFKMPTAAPDRQERKETMAEMAQALLRLEGEKIDVVPNTVEGRAEVISDKDLNMLLDRRPEVFVDRVKGWTSAGHGDEPADESEAAGMPKAAFAVYEAPTDQGNDALAMMLGENGDD
ncbi:SNF2-family ATP dependent chromatin remodeling factor snf21 [Marasmius fiardii PR-910]|nr:SNF2-family ATP dependent chromatin remodeling factor snf21 [Marasmius fiardii PR-910]